MRRCLIASVPCPFLEVCTFLVASALLEVQDFVLCGRHRTSDTFGFAMFRSVCMAAARLRMPRLHIFVARAIPFPKKVVNRTGTVT